MLPIDRVDRRLFGGRTLRVALCAVAIACGAADRWSERAFGQLNDRQAEAFCAALLANGEPGEYLCDGATYVIPEPTDAGVLEDCIASLERMRDEEECANVPTSDYFACEEEFSRTGCNYIPAYCTNRWDCPMCDGWWDCNLDTYTYVGSSR